VLHKSARLTSPNDFARTTKSGLRVTSSHFVGYLYLNNETAETSARLGLIIGKKFGNSVARHRLARKVRHAISIETFPQGSFVVIRALSTADAAHTIDVQSEVTFITEKLLNKSQRMAGVK
jgi:ribonuclease P protein component